MPTGFDLKGSVFVRSSDSSQTGGGKTGNLTINTSVGIVIGSLLFIILVIGFLIVSRARRRKANAPISPEDEFAKASFARWRKNMSRRSQQSSWPSNARRMTRDSASSPRTSTSSLSSDEKTWVDDEADLEVERRYVAYGVGSGRPRSSRIDLPSALPRAHIPR